MDHNQKHIPANAKLKKISKGKKHENPWNQFNSEDNMFTVQVLTQHGILHDIGIISPISINIVLILSVAKKISCGSFQYYPRCFLFPFSVRT
jgi:hypothetical protein